MNYPQFLTRCIGEELVYIFAESMQVNLQDRIVECTGKLYYKVQAENETTEILIAFGGGLQKGFTISSNFEIINPGTFELKLNIAPLKKLDANLKPSVVHPKEILKSIKMLEKDDSKTLLLNFDSENSMIFSAIENEQSRSSIVIEYLTKSTEKRFEGYNVVEAFYVHTIE